MTRNLSDMTLVRALRAKMLEDLQTKKDAASIVNNVYGGYGAPQAHQNAAKELASQGSVDDPENYDYRVKIKRTPTPGVPGGWEKEVMRERVLRQAEDESKGMQERTKKKVMGSMRA